MDVDLWKRGGCAAVIEWIDEGIRIWKGKGGKERKEGEGRERDALSQNG